MLRRKKKRTRNKFEAQIERQLRRAKIKFKYEPENIAYVLARHYVPDFILYTPHGKIYVETKGYLRKEDKAKLRAVKTQNPQIDLRLVFFENRKANNRWAEKNGFTYAIKTIPEDWITGVFT